MNESWSDIKKCKSKKGMCVQGQALERDGDAVEPNCIGVLLFDSHIGPSDSFVLPLAGGI